MSFIIDNKHTFDSVNGSVEGGILFRSKPTTQTVVCGKTIWEKIVLKQDGIIIIMIIIIGYIYNNDLYPF